MKKILFVGASLLFLASCTNTNNSTQTGTVTTTTGSVATGTTNTASNGPIATGSTVELYYNLHENNASGAVLDAGNMSDTGAITGQPFTTTVGQGGTIPGFEKALVGMKEGETKNFTVSPEEGYGTGMVTKPVAYEELAPVFTVTEDKNVIAGKVTKEEKIANIPEAFIKQYIDGKNPGDIITEESGTTLKLVSRNATSMTFEFEDKNSPFYGKEIKEGLSETSDGNTLKIIKIEGDKAVVEVTNTKSPFYNKDFKVGATGITEENGKKIETKILEINDTTTPKSIKVERTNTHPLANKTLYFTVKAGKVTASSIPPTVSTATGMVK